MASNEELQKRIDQLKISPTTGGVVQPRTQAIIDRLQGQMTPTTTGTEGTTDGTDSGDFLAEIRKRTLESFDILSSEDTPSDGAFADSIRGLEEAQETSAAGTRARFARLRGEEIEFGERRALQGLEGGGIATQTAILRNIKDDTVRDLRDLDLREQEALAIGSIEVAQSIANLKLQKMQFLQNAQQKVFENLINLGSFEISAQQAGQQGELNSLQIFSTKLDLLGSSLVDAGSFNALPQGVRDSLMNTARQQGISPAMAKSIIDAKASEPGLEMHTVGRTIVWTNRKGEIVKTFTAPSETTITDSQFIKSEAAKLDLRLTQSAMETGGFLSVNDFEKGGRAWVGLGLDLEDYVNTYAHMLEKPKESKTFKKFFQ